MKKMSNILLSSSLDEIGSIVSRFQASGKVAIISDENVYDLYYERCRQSLDTAGFSIIGYKFKAGEKSKSVDTYIKILEFLAQNKLGRSDSIIALGGGVTGDLAGFVSATYLRGVKLFQIPTTVLSMVDSSIGGKTGINLESGKNLAGAFYMPKIILQDARFLSTLPMKELHNGHAEMIKMGIISGEELFKKVSQPLYNMDLGNISTLIKTCSELKMKIISKDFHDEGRRQILNLGHTIGHAIEKLSGYKISHGEAVAKGLSVISDISEMMNYCIKDTSDAIKNTLKKCKFNQELPFSAEEISKAVRNDKKVRNDEISLILIEEIGRCKIVSMSLEEFDNCLREAIKRREI